MTNNQPTKLTCIYHSKDNFIECLDTSPQYGLWPPKPFGSFDGKYDAVLLKNAKSSSAHTISGNVFWELEKPFCFDYEAEGFKNLVCSTDKSSAEEYASSAIEHKLNVHKFY